MRTILFLLGLAAVLSLVSARPVTAQMTRADTAQVMYRVAQGLVSRGLVEEAELIFSLLERQYGDTDAARLAADALQASTSQREAGSGRTELVAWSTIYGASLGVLIPAALGANEAEPYGLGLLIGGPVGFGLSSGWSGRHQVSSGQARAMTFGSWWGTWQGVGWQQVLNLGDQERTECFDTGNGTECFTFHVQSDEAPFTAAVLGGLAGLAVGTAIGQARPITASSALITNFGAMWGSWYGTVLGLITNTDNFNQFGPNDDHHVLTMSLVGGNIGLLAGAFGAPSLGWSTGQAWSVHLAGIAGIVAGFGLDLLMSVDDEKGVIAIPGITSAIALGVASAMVTQSNRPTTGDTGMQFSMVEVDRGRVSLGLPTPVPTVVRAWQGTESRLVPGARVSLFRMAL